MILNIKLSNIKCQNFANVKEIIGFEVSWYDLQSLYEFLCKADKDIFMSYILQKETTKAVEILENLGWKLGEQQ